MPADQLLVLRVATAALVATVAGLTVRRRSGLCYTFFAYCLAAAICGFLIGTWPSVFWTRSFWMAKETLYSVLKTAIAIEIAYLTFRSFAGARPRVLLLAGVVIAATATAIATAPLFGEYLGQLAFVQARWQMGVVYLLVVVVLLATWHILPFHPFHRRIAWGFAFYLTVYGVLLRLVGSDIRLYPYLAAIEPAVYVATALYWCRAAWRPAGEPELLHADHRAAMRVLQERLRPAVSA